MNEWLLKNTTISENDYENIMQYRDIPKGEYYLSKNPKKQYLNVLINFTLNHPTILNCMKYKIKKTYKKIYHEKYQYKNIKFGIFDEVFSPSNPELYSHSREGQCHIKSLSIAVTLGKFYVATIIYKDIYDQKVLHSVLLAKTTNNEEIILDYTMNLIMKKEDYFNLTDAKIIKINSYKNLQKDKELFKDYNILNNISIDEYLCFRDEISLAVRKLKKVID